MTETLRVGIAPYQQMNARCLALYARGIHDCDPGMELEILSVIASMMNVSLDLRPLVGDYGCGYRFPNGTWTGLLGMLQRGEIDVTGNLCSIEPDRIEMPDFEPSQPVLQHRQGFLIRKPIVEYKFDIAGPFQKYVWMAAFGLLVAIFILNWMSSRALREHDSGRSSKSRGRSSRRTSSTRGSRGWTFDDVDDRGSPTSRALVITWAAFFAFTTGIYGAYITAVFLKPVQKERPFNDQVGLADSLLKGEYKLLDYHRSGTPMPRCYSNSTCEKFRSALKRHNYVIAVGDAVFGGSQSILGQLVAPQGGNLVMVNSFYWLQFYADYFDARRSDLWLIEDELSGEKWFSFFRQRNSSVARRFDNALIQMDSFKYYVADLYIGLGRNIFQGTNFHGPLLETFRMDWKLFRGAAECYAVGVAAAILAFAMEWGSRWKLEILGFRRKESASTAGSDQEVTSQM